MAELGHQGWIQKHANSAPSKRPPPPCPEAARDLAQLCSNPQRQTDAQHVLLSKLNLVPKSSPEQYDEDKISINS